MSIPPIIINGQPTCPEGYGLSPDGSQCLPISPPLSVNVAGVASQEIDPAQAARQSAAGYKASGIIERAVTAYATRAITIGESIIVGLFGLYDWGISKLGELFAAAQAQNSSGFYALAAALMADLTGLEVDGEALYNRFAVQGRVAAMQYLGETLLQGIAAELAGVPQAGAGLLFKAPSGAGVGGLPVKTYAPGDGIKAAETFVGFATSFSVREGNADALSDVLGNDLWDVGRVFKDFAEDFSKSLGLGRMLRVAIRPLLQIMVALPLQYDLNTQYRPTLLDVSDAIRSWKIGAFSLDDLTAELQQHGYSDARIKALTADKAKPLSVGDYRIALAASGKTLPAGTMTTDMMAARLAVEQYDVPTIDGLNQVLDQDPARKLSLTYVEHYVFQFLTGHITADAINSFLEMAQAASGVLLTAGEFAALKQLVASVSSNSVLRVRHLPWFTLQLAYIDGSISLDELQTHLEELGYAADDVTILILETLFKAKKLQEAAALKAAKGKTGKPSAGSTAAQQLTANIPSPPTNPLVPPLP